MFLCLCLTQTINIWICEEQKTLLLSLQQEKWRANEVSNFPYNHQRAYLTAIKYPQTQRELYSCRKRQEVSICLPGRCEHLKS